MEDDDGVRDLLASLEQASSTEMRVAALQALEAPIRQLDGLHDAGDELVSALRTQLKQANSLVSAKALSLLPVYVDKLTTGHDAHRVHHVRYALQTLVPVLVEKLIDHREKTRDAAKALLVQLGKAASAVTSAGTSSTHQKGQSETPFALFERLITEAGMLSKVAKIKEQTTVLLQTLRDSIERFPLRPFLSSLVDHLSDADPGVREASRATCIVLFSRASQTAKAELKKEIERKGTRKQTADAILEQVFAVDHGADGSRGAEQEGQLSGPTPSAGTHKASALPTGLHADDAGASSSSRSASRLGNAEANDVRAVYIASHAELDRTFSAMLRHFNGKESEHNWQAREQSIVKVRGMLKTSTHESYPGAFMAGLRQLHEGILKAAASLRTTLSMQAIALLSELARNLGDDLEGLAEVFLTALLRMAGFTKKMIANASQSAVADILTSVSYRHRYLDLVAQGLADKNPVTRVAMCQHLVTILNAHARHRKHALEAHGGIDVIVKFCKKTLTDANKDVRALAREAFYRVEEIWPATGRAIFDDLDAAFQKQVELNRTARGASLQPPPTPQRSADSAFSRDLSPRRFADRPGPSSALLAAKRAAAASLARERKQREEADARAKEEEDEEIMETQEELGVEPKEPQPSVTPLKLRGKSPMSSPSRAPPKSPLRARSPYEGGRSPPLPASSIPLPSSPGGSAMRTTVKTPTSMIGSRSRTTSSSSMSSNRSANRFGAATTSANTAAERFGSIAQRFDQTPARTAQGTRDGAPASSVQSALSRSRGVSESSHHEPSIRREIDEDDNAKRTSESVADIPAESFDSSRHISSPTPGVRGVVQSPAAPLSLRGAGDVSLSAVSPASSHSSSSPSVRSRLPRPVSMLHSPMHTPYVQQASRHTHSLSTDARTIVSTPPQAKSQASSSNTNGSQLNAGARQHEQGSGIKAVHTEAIPADAPSATKWFLGKAKRLDNAQLPDMEPELLSLSPVKRRPESDDYVAQLLDGRAGLRTFKNLVSLSKEFRLPERPAYRDEEFDNGDPQSQQGSALGLTTNGEAAEEYAIAVSMWQEGRLFERLFGALSTYLRSNKAESKSRDLQTAALILLHRLVDHQFGLFAALGRERDLVDLLLDLVGTCGTGSAATAVKSACQTIADRWTEQTDVIVGIATLRSLLAPYLGDSVSPAELPSSPGGMSPAISESVLSSAAILTLALRCLASLFGRLPAELVEEQMERCKAMVKQGLNNRHIETRQQAVGVLVAANSKLHDPQSLFGILQPIDKAQQDLLVYYMNKG